MKKLFLGFFGIAIGGLFLWVSLRGVTIAELAALIASMNFSAISVAIAVYWLAMLVRASRWFLLLREIHPVQFSGVAETLVVGYAVNNLLPARLGEVFRAVYAKRILKLGRARVFGSILIERILDFCAILVLLVSGLWLTHITQGANQVPTFEVIAMNAMALVGAVIFGVVALRSGGLNRIPMPDKARLILDDFRIGLGTLNRSSALAASGLTIVIWALETYALIWIFLALSVSLSLWQAILLMGAVSLSTLVPTAPGYLGTYQLVFAIAMTAFGLSESVGIVASTASQLFLFGSVVIVGLAFLCRHALQNLGPLEVSNPVAD
ncbi:MAG: lysylphosphatidylglycerol synthase transmembrane domain-containing protein [Pseudomonadota bacterium]